MEGWEGWGGYRGEQQPFGLCLHHSCNNSKRCPQQLFASARVHVLLRVMYAGTKLCKLVPSTHVLSMVTSVLCYIPVLSMVTSVLCYIPVLSMVTSVLCYIPVLSMVASVLCRTSTCDFYD